MATLPTYTFNPGPSAVYPDVRQYLADAFEEGWLSAPHRSERFISLVRLCLDQARLKLNIPQDYTILFTSSATECWEILAQSLTPRRSFHLYNGSFGQKWFDYARALRPSCTGLKFDINDVPDPATLPFNSEETDLVCITQNETSTATQLRDQFILNTFNRLGPSLLAVDATSSLGGVALKFIKADVWYGSVQKCLGLPAGLGIMVLSPRAVARAREVGDNAHYNSINGMVKQMLNYQTTHTPNVLGIYLLSRVLQAREPIKTIAPHLSERAQKLYDYFEQIQPLGLRPLIENVDARSTTVIGLQGSPTLIEEVKRRARDEAGLQLGSGYGDHKATSLRIANFPAVPDAAFEALVQFFEKIRNEDVAK
jgi:phosphoserine aminotransferase